MAERERGRESIQSMVRDDLRERERLGIERYGTELYPHNGRDALQDAYEEALDLALYLRQAIEERKPSLIGPQGAHGATVGNRTDQDTVALGPDHFTETSKGDEP